MKKGFVYGLFSLLVILSSIGGGVVGAYLSQPNKQTQASILNNQGSSNTMTKPTYVVEESQVIDTVKKVSPSVVSIVISKDLPLYRQGFRNFGIGLDPFFNFPAPYPEYEKDDNGNVKSQRVKIGGGSGFIISKDGLIVTNRHVVEDENAAYTVITSDGEEFDAKVLAKDTISDFGVLKLDDSKNNKIENLSYVELGNSDALEIGQKVVAIGNALGEFQNTVTTGIVSGKGRNIPAGSAQSSENLINLIQTDAAINPGNSGGPLVNLQGEVIGINTAIASDGQGIGFAIPINDVKSLIKNVEENGKLMRGFLGVRFMMLDENKSKELQIGVKNGALLVGNDTIGEFAVAPGSPADKAGLQMKDVILELDGEEINERNTLDVLIAKKKPGDKISLKIWRSGDIKEVTVALGESN